MRAHLGAEEQLGGDRRGERDRHGRCVENEVSSENGAANVSSGPICTSSSPSTAAAPAPTLKVCGCAEARSVVPAAAPHEVSKPAADEELRLAAHRAVARVRVLGAVGTKT